MLSPCSSTQSSLAEVVQLDTSKSEPHTPAKKQHHRAFRTVPESPIRSRPLSDDGLDIEILTHKLQLHQLELEQAQLRAAQRRTMAAKEAADVAAAQRFRDGLVTESFADTMSKRRPRSTSLHTKVMGITNAVSSRTSITTKIIRSRRPDPLELSAASTADVPQVQSAALPISTSQKADMERAEVKRHWRRTTISAGRNSGAKIFMISSPGNVAEYDFEADIPPVPQLSASASTATSPPTMSPLTPLPTEDQIRRELETFALEEGPDLRKSRRNSTLSRRRIPAAFVPCAEDRVLPASTTLSDATTALVDVPEMFDAKTASRQSLSRKKSFFSRFERKNEVDALLDLYLTDDQLAEEKNQKRKSTKSRRQTFLKRWQTGEHDESYLHKAG